MWESPTKRNRMIGLRLAALVCLFVAAACTSDDASGGFGPVATDQSEIAADQSDTAPEETTAEGDLGDPEALVIPGSKLSVEGSALDEEWLQHGYELILTYETDWNSCLATIETCDGEDLFAETSKAVAYDTRVFTLSGLRDRGARIEPGTPVAETLALVEAVEIDMAGITDDPIGMAIVACYLDDGVVYKPLDDGSGSRQILNDEVVVQTIEFIIGGESLDSLQVALAYDYDFNAGNEGLEQCDLL